jgi:predicted dinucleotide-binding enzyme
MPSRQRIFPKAFFTQTKSTEKANEKVARVLQGSNIVAAFSKGKRFLYLVMRMK